MLSKGNRLKKKEDFKLVFNKGKKIKGIFLYLKAVQNGLGESRFGIIISKKVDKKATVRNLIKRRTRAVIKENLPKIKTNIDCIVFFISLPENFISLKKDIEECFEKLKLYV
ncbi:MAG: ribonuclease P protein component [Candidatus Pacebacteria bacterium]|nr:ribonuclease P protein component [Candidatus Paceibacterota bacterium]MDD3729148.1 ribonuclease P protein component [Candidatus Paceibacterota bacterium]MDD4201816.1 ribonuclease P protein component [Candidatus Paceibacterota bacterium]MDD4897632.1 ribonuclease P protein component [Candidatus Paceibacterota bacterium]MDD5446154.1 ribonuclease P protein component [Candidatus Paceibacterota bacterium]